MKDFPLILKNPKKHFKVNSTNIHLSIEYRCIANLWTPSHDYYKLTWKTCLALSMAPLILAFGIWILGLAIKVVIFFSSNLAITVRSKPINATLHKSWQETTLVSNMNQTLYLKICYLFILSNVFIVWSESVYPTLHKSCRQPKDLSDNKGNKNLQMSISSSTMVMK